MCDQITARNKRINAYGRSVYDIYRGNHFIATVETNGNASGGLRVLLGALQPHGKTLAAYAIHALGDDVPTHYDAGGTNGAPMPGALR